MVDDHSFLPGEGDEVADGEKIAKPEADLDDLRASMAEEEQARLREKKNSGLLKKVTGLLRKKTGTLEDTQAQPAESRPPGPFTRPLSEESFTSDETPSVDVERAFTGQENEEISGLLVEDLTAEEQPLEASNPQPEAGSAFVWVGEDLEPALKWEPEESPPAFHSAAFETGEEAWVGTSSDQPIETGATGVPAFDEDENVKLALDASLIESTLKAEAQIAAVEDLNLAETGSAGDQSVSSISAQPDDLRAELMPETAPVVEAPKKSTRTLLKRFTGWLNPDSVQPEEPLPQVTDDELAERLSKVQLTEAIVEIPGQRKFVYAESEPEQTADVIEVSADGEDKEEEQIDPFSRLSQAAETESKVTAPSIPRDLAGESLLNPNWVDSQAQFLTEEPVAEEYIGQAAAPELEGAARTTSRLSELSATTEEAPPAIEEVRSQVLVDYEESPADAVLIPPQTFGERASAWSRKNLGWLIGLGMVLVAVIILLQLAPWEKSSAALPNTPVPSNLPYPVGLELTGGWFFDVNRSTIIENQWQPKGAEWLDNSQLRRVVALPWNKQTDAVIQTLEHGDQINLVFSNNDLMPFAVQSVERLDRGDTSLFTAKEPGLVIFLYGEESDQRWVVLALPKN